jgi:hypothetical protein
MDTERTITTAQTLGLIKALAVADFQPLGRTDRSMYEGAADDALIATGGDAQLIADLTGRTDLETGANTMEVIVSEGRVELHACTPEGEMHAVTLILDADAL